jgi:hypothetical protein
MIPMLIEAVAVVLVLASAPVAPPAPARSDPCGERVAGRVADCCARPSDAHPTLDLPDPFRSAPLPAAARANHERTPGDAEIR